MNTALIAVQLSEPLKHDAIEHAQKDGLSVSDWRASAVEQRLHQKRLLSDFYRRRAAGGDASTFLAILNCLPDPQPDSGDEPQVVLLR